MLVRGEGGRTDLVNGRALRGDAAWVGSSLVEAFDGDVYLDGHRVGSGEMLRPAVGGVIVVTGQASAAALGPSGWVPVDREVARSFADGRVRHHRGGDCVERTLGHDSDALRIMNDRLGPEGRFTRCVRARDGRVFDHSGLAIDVDVTLSRRRFIDLETGREVGFPPWAEIPFYVLDSWEGGCAILVHPDGEVSSSWCW